MEKILFVSAQPDIPYFHWQIKLYVHNFLKYDIKPNQIHVILGITNENFEPSDGGLEILKTGVNVHFIKDERNKKNYLPSIKPYLITKWLEKNESYGDCFFLHDSDIIFSKKINIEKLLSNDIIYMSDTKSYIGYDYLKNCSRRYEKKFENCYNEQLIDEMLNIVQLEKKIIIENKENSGGAQYIIKKTNSFFWKKVYEDSFKLYDQMMKFQKKYPLRDGKVQFWTAEMWSLLWNLWKFKRNTEITKELDFSWATDTIDKFLEKPILHMAGITEEMKYTKFFKGDFIEKDPIEMLKNNFDYFNYIDSNNITIKYIDNIKSYLKN